MLTSLLLPLLFAITQGRPQRPVLEIAARQLLGNFVAGRFEAATKDFNEEMKAMVIPSVLAEQKSRLEAEAGAFQHITAVHQRTEGEFQAIELIVSYKKAPVSFLVTFDHSNRIGAVSMHPILPDPIDPPLEAAARELLANFVARRFADMSAHFDATMKAQLPTSRLATLSEDVTRIFGAFRSVTAVRQETAQELRIIDLSADYEKEPVTVRVVFNKAGEVSGLYISPLVKKRGG